MFEIKFGNFEFEIEFGVRLVLVRDMKLSDALSVWGLLCFMVSVSDSKFKENFLTRGLPLSEGKRKLLSSNTYFT